MIKKLTDAFTYIFSDNEWFNKVLVGGFYFLLIPFGIGIIMLNGFLIELISKINNGEKGMPYWRNYKIIFTNGLRRSWLSLILVAVVYLAIFSSPFEFTIPIFILVLSIFVSANTIIITKSFDLISLIVSIVLLIIAISIGWMWIVVGWPLLIFLAILVQTLLFANHQKNV